MKPWTENDLAALNRHRQRTGQPPVQPDPAHPWGFSEKPLSEAMEEFDAAFHEELTRQQDAANQNPKTVSFGREENPPKNANIGATLAGERDEAATPLRTGGHTCTLKKEAKTEGEDVLCASEHEEQCALFAWAAQWEGRHPELALLFAIPNGGHRHPATAAKLKAEGVKAGVPDVCCPIPRRGYAGLYIELKRNDGGVVSQAQACWIHRLREQGYRVFVAEGQEQAMSGLVWYLDLPEEVLPK